jgi:hypothetical protein
MHIFITLHTARTVHQKAPTDMFFDKNCQNSQIRKIKKQKSYLKNRTIWDQLVKVGAKILVSLID